jgi:hypothetical protein
METLEVLEVVDLAAPIEIDVNSNKTSLSEGKKMTSLASGFSNEPLQSQRMTRVMAR